MKNIVKKFKETGTIKERARSGRSKKTTSKEDRIIVRLTKVNRCASCASIRHDFVGSSGKDISRRTINRWLTAAGFKSRKARKVSMLTYSQRMRRLRWAEKYQHWNVSKWCKVLFSDEAHFRFASDKPVFVCWQSGEAFLPQCLSPTLKYGGGEVIL